MLINNECITEKAYIKPVTNLYNKICNDLPEIVVKNYKRIVAQDLLNMAVRINIFDEMPNQLKMVINNDKIVGASNL